MGIIRLHDSSVVVVLSGWSRLAALNSPRSHDDESHAPRPEQDLLIGGLEVRGTQVNFRLKILVSRTKSPHYSLLGTFHTFVGTRMMSRRMGINILGYTSVTTVYKGGYSIRERSEYQVTRP
jgi:hypothetical protein